MVRSEQTNNIRLIEQVASLVEQCSDRQFWPIIPIRSFPYFEMEETKRVIHAINNISKERSIPDIAKLFHSPFQIVGMLVNIVLAGLKGLYTLDEISKQDIDDTLELMIKIMLELKLDLNSSHEVRGLNFLQAKDISALSHRNFCLIDANNKNIGVQVNKLNICLRSLCYAMYTDYFQFTGQFIHGPYPIKIGEKDSNLIIFEYYDLKPSICADVQDLPFSKVKIYVAYSSSVSINALMQQLGDYSPKAINAYLIEVDGKEVGLEYVSKFIPILTNKVSTICARVNNLKDKDKVRLLSMVSQYNFKTFYELTFGRWYDPQLCENGFNKFGDYYLDMNPTEPRSLDHLKLLFNPYLKFSSEVKL